MEAAPAHIALLTGAMDITLQQMRDCLYAAVVSDALDGLSLTRQSPAVRLERLSGQGVLVGRCRTSLWADMDHEDPEPYALELRAVDACQQDDVLIAAAGGSMRSGIWGELLTTAVLARGCVGAIIDGAVRDLRQIRELQFPVYARGTCVYDSLNRQRVIDLDVPVEIGGVRFSPGDLVVADVDGIVVVPQASEAEAVQRAWAKVHDENEVRDAIRGGMSATEAFQRYGVL